MAIFLRARDELAAAELVAAEDTRRTGQLLTTLGLSRLLVSLHEHNESERIVELLEKLRAGARIALVSDAGTPLLSDPGFELVRRVAQEGMPVIAVPGPSAITAALSIAGLPTERFTFEGFLPARLAERRTRIGELRHETRTLVFFEAPHRIAESLEDLAAGFGADRRAAVARELTKVFETVYRATLSQLAAQARSDANLRAARSPWWWRARRAVRKKPSRASAWTPRSRRCSRSCRLARLRHWPRASRAPSATTLMRAPSRFRRTRRGSDFAAAEGGYGFP